MTGREPRIGLVLGGGGIAGYAFHGAVLHTLQQETGFDPRTAEIIVGTSAGAITGAVLRGDVPASEMRERLLASADDPDDGNMLKMLSGRPKAVPRLWAGPGAPRMVVSELRRGRGIRLSTLVAAALPQGRQDLSPVGEPLDTLHGSEWPERELWITATDLRSGRLRVFGRDSHPPVAQAVEASAALPVFFSPVTIDGRQYIDGGIRSPFNADLLAGQPDTSGRGDGSDPQVAAGPLDLVIVLAPLSINELQAGLPFSSVARSLPRRRLRGEIRKLEDGGSATLVFQPGRAVSQAMGLNPMDHRRVEAIVARSEELVLRQLVSVPGSTIEILERAGRLLKPPPDRAYPSF